MGEEEASDKITNYNLILYADFFETIELNENTWLNIYKNDKEETAYYLYFYDNYLYRIEICNHIGYSYNNPRFSYPSEKSKIDDIKEKLIGEFGEVSKTDIKYYTFYDKPFEEYWFRYRYIESPIWTLWIKREKNILIEFLFTMK